MMFTRAAGRRLRRDAFRRPTTLTDQLTLPWLCPAQQSRKSSNFPSITTTTQAQDLPQRRRRRSLSPRNASRRLATTADLQPTPSAAAFNPFHQEVLGRQNQPMGLSQLPAWSDMKPIVIRDSVAAAPPMRDIYGYGANPLELHQNLYACLRIGRLERASVILERLTAIYDPTAPEVTDAHNAYLHAMFETAQQEPKDTSMATIETWYRKRILDAGVTPNAQTYISLVRAAMNFIEEPAQDDKVRQLLEEAQQLGPDVMEAINSSPDFTDEEWDALIRLQPEAYEEPPPPETLQPLNASSQAAREKLRDFGLPVYETPAVNPVAQKGLGMSSLKQALGMFDSLDSVPYPHDMEGTQEEKDRAFAYARQLRMEQDSMDAAVARWKLENEKMAKLGIHGVLNSRPVQAIMYDWYEALVPLFQQRIAHANKVLAAGVKEHIRDDAASYGPWLVQCKPERLAAMTVARGVNSCMRGHKEDSAALKVSALSVTLGTDIQDYINAQAHARRNAFVRKQRKQTRKDLVEKLSKTSEDSAEAASTSTSSSLTSATDHDKRDIALTVRTKLGAMCLELLLQAATMIVTAADPKTGAQMSTNMAAFHHQVGFYQGKKIGYMIPHHALLEKLRNESVHNIATVKLPMVVEPRKWTSFDDGGYYTTPERVVRQKNGDSAQRAYAQSAIENGDMQKVLSGLDTLGRVPWQINSAILQVMTEAWNSGEAVGGLVTENMGLERPLEPPADAGYRARALWGKELQAYENEKSGCHSQRCFQNFQLETARAFAKEKQIFFPHSVDFRGRAYPLPPILNHIGSDLARGLLKFARGKELGAVGLQWLKIHLANLYGFDKASLREREQFAVDNMDEIYDSANNPLTGRRWWVKAEDPWQCLACCIELRNAFDLPDPTRYMSQLPVHQDGTCNGLQHYAALGGDHAGARQVNLEPSDRPQDIYTGVAELVKEEVAQDAAKGRPMAKFVHGYVTRKVVKRTVMTNVYGVTFMGAKAQVYEELKHIFPNFKPTPKLHSLQSVAMYIAAKIFNALGKIFNGAQEIQYWLGECGDRITTSLSPEQIQKIKTRFDGDEATCYSAKYKPPKKVNAAMKKRIAKSMESLRTSIIWTTPLKMPIVQPYRKDHSQIIRTKVQDITVTKRTIEDEVDKRKQLQAFPPNFIHSLDATHMILSALKCSEMGLDFAAVHDSFWTHASDIPDLNVILRDAFVRMHSEDIMNRLSAEFTTRYAGHMYRATLLANSEVGQKITAWRSEYRKTKGGKTLRASELRSGSASFDEVALEAKRQELLNSEDPAERKEGEDMVTPTSIWLANPDPKSFSSFRLALLGETKDRSSIRTEEVRDKVRTAEAEAIVNDPTSSIPDVAYTLEEAAETEQAELDDDAALDAPSPTASTKPHSSRVVSERAQIQVWLPLTFPPVPKKGTWDVSRLRESKYFFS
ncbi:mitochondrial DNA-directed RNA polymeras-like protein [Plenodomus tracheiphilus IPT5]|uniref:DNA-directed RNA polymerase n=1 Tax=Plenodomus tracheiphilus IPT5 TaxID=1408161 RepID=A0A6A7ARX9_9PLEO|nr:mitochondrial DNA-directed RNA polymeras-like protein [Plenodomus tracheiphilus IPT5]